MPGLRLMYQERCEIGKGLRAGDSLREVARSIGRPCSTVAREVARNGGRDRYRAPYAQNRWFRTKRRPKPFRLESNRRLARMVERLLCQRWSPEQISARLRRDHPSDPHYWVSAEAIYHSLYVQTRGGLKRELTDYLRRGKMSRQRQGGGHIPDRILISQRPAEAMDRAVPGHWEGDLIMGAANQTQVGIITERSTRYTILFALSGKTSSIVIEAVAERIRDLPGHLQRSLTWDQGKEMSQHVRFTIATGVQVYFCDPGHPWQRGTAENTVGLVRQYLPKGTALDRHDQRRLDAISRELNGRPREVLGWDTPAEAYARVLASQ